MIVFVVSCTIGYGYLLYRSKQLPLPVYAAFGLFLNLIPVLFVCDWLLYSPQFASIFPPAVKVVLGGSALVVYAIGAAAAGSRLADHLQELFSDADRRIGWVLLRAPVVLWATFALTLAVGMTKALAQEAGWAKYEMPASVDDLFDDNLEDIGSAELSVAASCDAFLASLHRLSDEQLRIQARPFSWLFAYDHVLPMHSDTAPWVGHLDYGKVQMGADVKISVPTLFYVPPTGPVCTIGVPNPSSSTLAVAAVADRVAGKSKDLKETVAGEKEHRTSTLIAFALTSSAELIGAKSYDLEPKDAFAKRLDTVLIWVHHLLEVVVVVYIASPRGRQVVCTPVTTSVAGVRNMIGGRPTRRNNTLVTTYLDPPPPFTDCTTRLRRTARMRPLLSSTTSAPSCKRVSRIATQHRCTVTTPRSQTNPTIGSDASAVRSAVLIY